MKITIDTEGIVGSVEDPTVFATRELVMLCYRAMLTTGHAPQNIAEAMQDVGEEITETFNTRA